MVLSNDYVVLITSFSVRLCVDLKKVETLSAICGGNTVELDGIVPFLVLHDYDNRGVRTNETLILSRLPLSIYCHIISN